MTAPALTRGLGWAKARRISPVAWVVVGVVAVWLVATNLPLAVIGLLIGCIYALGAVGMTLIFGNLRFANIAHGDYMTLGAYFALWVQASVIPGVGTHGSVWIFTFAWPILLALPAAMLVVGVIAVAVDLVVFKRMRRRGAASVAMALASLGVAISLRGVVQIVWGTQPERYERISKKFFILLGDIRVPPDLLFVAAAALLITGLVYLLLARTKLGKAMRATADNPDLARGSGIDTERVNAWTWLIGVGLAAAAGVLLAISQAQLLPYLGWKVLIPIFAAVVVGGIGSPYGALVGGLLIGLTAEVSTTFDWLNPSYKPAVAFAVLVVVLLVRPRGIFGSGS